MTRLAHLRGYLGCGLLVLAGCFPSPEEDAETVVVVHGLGRTPASMSVLEYHLEAQGYRVVSFGYPSRTEPMERLVDRLAEALDRCCAATSGSVHFVTHSMGGILVRSYLAEQAEPHHGRVVMLSPPAGGSELIDTFEDSPLLRLIVGPAGVQLGTGSGDTGARFAPVRFDLGVITGSRSFNPVASWIIPGPDDGKVAVDNARIEGATDFLVVPATHTFIMNRTDVAEATLEFLREGRFR